MDCSTPGFPVDHQLQELAQTHVHWVSDAIQSSHSLSSPSPPAFNLSQHQGLFKWVLRIRWSKYWSFRFTISPSNEYSGLIFFRMDWLDLLAVQGTLKSLLQHHRSKSSILWHSAFLIASYYPILSKHLILRCPLLLLPLIFPSIRVFSNESVIRIGGQRIGVSASASMPQMNIQDWFPLGWTGWISLWSKGH